MDDISSQLANGYRRKYGIPMTYSNDQVLAYAHYTDPEGFLFMQNKLLAPQTAGDFNPALGQTATVQGQPQAPATKAAAEGADVGPKPSYSTLAEGLSQEYGSANGLLEKTPIVGPVLKAVGDVGAQKMAEVNESAKQIGAAEGPIVGGLAKAGAMAAGAVLPQNALGAGLLLAPFAGKGLGLASEGLESAGAAGGSLASEGLSKVISAAGKAATGVHPDDIAEVLAKPEILSGTESAKDVGSQMNEWGKSMGVATGAEAGEKLPGMQSESHPTLSTGKKFADDVLSRLDEINYRASNRADHIAKLAGYADNAEDIAGDIAVNRVRKGQTVAGAPSSSPLDSSGRLIPSPNNPESMASGEGLTSSVAAEQALRQIDVDAKTIRDFATSTSERLKAQGQKDLQDLLTAKNTASKLNEAPSYDNPREATNTYSSAKRLRELDNAIYDTAESLRPGSGDEYFDMAQRYHEAKIREKFSSLLPVNANGSPSVLGAKLGAAGGASSGAAIGAGLAGAPGAAIGGTLGAGAGLAVQSPALLARAIRTAAFMRDMGAAMPGAVAGLGAKAGTVGLAAGAANESESEGK